MINQIWFKFGDLLVNCLPDPSSSKQGGPKVGTWSWHLHCDGCSCPMGLECWCLLNKSNTGKHAALQSRWWQSPGSNGMQNYDTFDNLVELKQVLSLILCCGANFWGNFIFWFGRCMMYGSVFLMSHLWAGLLLKKSTEKDRLTNPAAGKKIPSHRSEA